ncbi:MAG: Ldh family oxidoreductase [bacterium]|nr:Ldh family oxidoreductase [bacterium]
MPIFNVAKLEGACAAIFEGAGLAAEEAVRVTHSLMLANLMGHDSHGVIRVVQYIQALQGGRDTFKEEMASFIDWLKTARLMPGFDEILVPGEMENRMCLQKEQDGVFVDDETWRQIQEIGTTVGVDVQV